MADTPEVRVGRRWTSGLLRAAAFAFLGLGFACSSNSLEGGGTEGRADAGNADSTAHGPDASMGGVGDSASQGDGPSAEATADSGGDGSKPPAEDGGVGADAGTGGTRQTLNFNQAWKFYLGDVVGAQASAYDDTTWSQVGLPHSFSLPYFLSSQFYTGYGWYRKHVTIPSQSLNKRVFLQFEGAFQDAEVYVNGTLVGEHKGGYTGFSYDVTSALVAGDNVVAVRLNNNWNAQLAPRAGEHTFSGGIYRDVYLVTTDPVHVTWCGTFVTTPTVSATTATVRVQTEIQNSNSVAKPCTVRTDITDASGSIVATVSSTQTVAANATVTFDQTTPAIANPMLWHPDHPTLYSAVTTVSDGTTKVDDYVTPFGFRWFSWTTSGFSINGSHYYLHGADVHQDHAGWGDGVTNAGFLRDVQMVKSAGFNFIRGSHYPKDPAFAEACDELGVLLWSENPFWGMGGATGEGNWLTAGSYPNNAGDETAFETSVTDTLTDMIRIHRNHPSIVAWSMSNEPFFTASATMTKMSALLKTEVDLTHQLDPTRPAGIGGAQRPLGSGRIDMIGDVAGYNGDGATQAEFQNPGIPNLVTEYGSVTATRPGTYDPGWGVLSATLTNGFPTEYSWRSGQALWCAFDHGSIGGTKLETMGIVDYFRLPKRAWYWYRNAYASVVPPTWPVSGTPAGLQLTSDKTILAAVDGTDDTQLIVTVVDSAGTAINNNVAVTLTIESGPGEFPTGTTITFTPASGSPQSDIAIADGKAAIEFRSYYAGTTVIKATSTGLTAATITITSQGSPPWVQGVTPPTPARPYTRYTGSLGGTTSATLALNRPTSASSDVTTSGNANDGSTTTSWQAATTDTSPWWSVNLELSYTITSVVLTFPTSANYRYTIDVSVDGTTWTTVVDESQTTSTAQTRTATGSFGSSIQFVRISFVGQPAALAEVVVSGQ
jgi:beta-galactosidase